MDERESDAGGVAGLMIDDGEHGSNVLRYMIMFGILHFWR